MQNACAILRQLLVALSIVGCSIGPACAAEVDSAKSHANATDETPKIFDIVEYVVDGNAVLSVDDIEEAVYPFLGESRTPSDVDKARDALEKVYRERGYQTVQVTIPKQGVGTGIIHLQVVQNPIGRLRVVDSRYHTLTEIKQSAPSLAEGTVPNLNEVQKDIVALNQQPDMKVTPRLKAGLEPGTVDVDLQVEDRLPLHASAELNNQYNQQTTPLRVEGNVSYDNLWQLGHSISFSYQVAPEKRTDAEVYSSTYLFRVPETPLSILLYGVKSNSEVAALASVDVIGKGGIVGFRGILSLPSTDTFYQSITIGLDRKNLTQNVITNGQPLEAPVLYYPVSLTYAPTWHHGNELTQASASLNFAVPGLGDDSTAFDAQRFDALRQYFFAKAELNQTQPLPWGAVFYGKIVGQIASGPLLSSEQMSAGGVNNVRGYFEAERLGDSGLQATLELRSPSFGPQIAPAINDWRVLAFVDAAALWLRQPLPDETASYALASAGVGTRFSLFDTINGSVDVAVPFVSGSATKVGEPRFHFRFWAGL